MWNRKTPGSADTPGFPSCGKPTIKRDLNGTRLELPRPSIQKKLQMIPSSMFLCQSWRANCDFQYMFYDSDPKYPDAQEIARVTDYVVAYACKGVETIQAEKDQIQDLIMAAKSKTETSDDVKRVARQILNHSIGEKLISKQECMVQLLELDLYVCSESIKHVSLSGYRKITDQGIGASKNFRTQYQDRTEYMDDSLYEYFVRMDGFNKQTKKAQLPHFTGTYCKPIYPPTPQFATAMLAIHKPWSKKHLIDKKDPVKEFLAFIKSHECPSFVRLPYERAKKRYKTGEPDPIQKMEICTASNLGDDCDPNLIDACKIWSIVGSNHIDDTDLYDYDFGENHNWSKPVIKIPTSTEEAGEWLMNKIKAEEDIESQYRKLDLPLKTMADGTTKFYEIEDLEQDQKQLICEILKKINEWVESGKSKKTKNASNYYSL